MTMRLTRELLDEMVRAGIESGAFLYPRDDAFPVPSTEWHYSPEMRNEEVKPVAIESKVVLEAGSMREGTTLSSRTFFVSVTPTGAEVPIGQCPVLKREHATSSGRFGTPDFVQTTQYFLRGEGRLKMVCLSSAFGRPRRIVHLYVDIGPEHPVIEFTGVGGCGRFVGRGTIDLKASAISERGQGMEVSVDILRDNFKYQVKQPGAHSGPRKGRSLII